MKAPQIIGWISQIVPALPRLNQSSTTTGGGGTEVTAFIAEPGSSSTGSGQATAAPVASGSSGTE